MSQSAGIETRLEAFKSWFTANGGYIHPLAELAADPARGVHLRVRQSGQQKLASNGAAKSIPKGTKIISCPHSLSLSALNARDYPPLFPIRPTDATSLAINLPKQFLQEARPQCVAAVLLYAQSVSSKESFWKEYLDVLPSAPSVDEDAAGLELDSPLWWDEEELSWIQGTNLGKGRQDLMNVWRGEWERWKPVVSEWTGGLGWEMSWTNFVWAMTILGSRAFSSSQITHVPLDTSSTTSILASYNPDMLLYPGIDSLNHNPLSQNRWFSNAERFGIICEDEPVEGEECWNPYGGKGNGELLLSYGFTLPNNPCDTFALKLAQAPPAFLLPLPNASSSLPINADTNQSTTDGGPSPMTPHNRPPALSLQHNTYFIRASSRASLLSLDQHYPSPSPPSPLSNTNNSHHLEQPLAGFPHLLLSTLSITLANSRERRLICSIVQTEPQVSAELWTAVGTRNSFAVMALLYARLTMEVGRLNGVLEIVEADAAEDGERRKRRRAAAQTYLQGQKGILDENIMALENSFVMSMTTKPTANLGTSSQTTTSNAILSTLPQALHALSGFKPQIARALISGLQILYGTSSLQTIREDFPGEEENIWTMFLAIAASTLMTNTTRTEPEASMESGPTERRVRELMEWLKEQGFELLATGPDQQQLSHELDVQLENNNEAEVVELIISRVSTVFSTMNEESGGGEGNDSEADIFSPEKWSRQLVAACVRVVSDESIAITLSPERYQEMRETEALNTGTEDPDGFENEEVIPDVSVVCMCFGSVV